MLVGLLILATFWFIGFAHLHSLWGCLAFVGLPFGFGLFCLGFCPLGFLFAVLVVFGWTVCTFGVVRAPRPPDAMELFVPVGVLPSVFLACFRCGLLPLLWLPPRVYLGAVQTKVHTMLGHTKLCFGVPQLLCCVDVGHHGKAFNGF